MPNDGASKLDPDHSGALIRPATDAAIREAAAYLRTGHLVAIPTETVYGLAADATNSLAVARIFEAKGRPRFNPLIVHVADLAEAKKLGQFSEKAMRLARAFWPGPLTLVIPRLGNCPVSELASAGLPSLAVRVPAHAIAQSLLAVAQRPLAAPSANRSGRVSSTTALHVAEDLASRVAMILDAGPAQHGLESTVLDATGDSIVLLRPGALPAEDIEEVLGELLIRTTHNGTKPLSPGQLESHYAPRAALRLDASDVRAGEALLAFGPTPLPTRGPTLNLSPTGELVEAAAQLFSYLRELDASGAATIAVMAIPDTGLGEAINDRLRRAAAPRPAI